MQTRLKPIAILLAAIPLLARAQAESGPIVADPIVIKAGAIQPLGASSVSHGDIAARRPSSSDTASLLRDVPGLSLYGAGGVSSLPSLHGLADDRIRIQVDGMDLISSCPNHMNSPLSYIDPSNVESVKVYSGITPVSIGGDSIGGTIQVNSAKPEFAQVGKGLLSKGQLGTYYRSNGNASASNLSATLAGENLSFYFRGSQAESGNYMAAEDFKARATLNGTAALSNKSNVTVHGNEVASTRYKTENQEVGFALRHKQHLLDLKVGIQRIPYEDYPNQRMDMLDNQSSQFNLRYSGIYDWGKLEGNLYRQLVKHFMNFDIYKTSMFMPMNTESQTQGGSVKATLNYSDTQTIRTGVDIVKYALKDWWPPVNTTSMGPNTQWNIQDGIRDRAAIFGELETQHSKDWLSLIGIRRELVKTNTGDAVPYNPSDTQGTARRQYLTDSATFNAKEREQTDHNWDLTLLARYTPSETQSYEGGYARKSRSPNLYQRYTWPTDGMSAIMNNFVGDGNGYRGDPGLKPEVAHTLSLTGNWHDPEKAQWGFRATPYYTYVQNYIDAQRCTTSDCALDATSKATQARSDQFIVLDYVNQNALLYGLDLSGFQSLGRTEGYGVFTLTGLVNYSKGQNKDTGDYLYNIMPLNAKIALNQKIGSWSNTLETQFVSGKNEVSATRNEIPTDAYSLLNLRTSYEMKQARFDLGIENVFDRFYQLPLGGAYTGQGGTMGQNNVAWNVPVPGMGRTAYAGLTLKF